MKPAEIFLTKPVFYTGHKIFYSALLLSLLLHLTLLGIIKNHELNINKNSIKMVKHNNTTRVNLLSGQSSEQDKAIREEVSDKALSEHKLKTASVKKNTKNTKTDKIVKKSNKVFKTASKIDKKIPAVIRKTKKQKPQELSLSQPKNNNSNTIKPDKAIKKNSSSLLENNNNSFNKLSQLATEPKKAVKNKLSKGIELSVSNENRSSIKENYTTKIHNKINENKKYPLNARRRNIEGRVRVSFDVIKNGDITNLRLSEAQALLKKASLKAIKKSLPLPEIPDKLEAPVHISFYMSYRLN